MRAWFLLLIGCITAPEGQGEWSDARVISGIFTTLDRNGDGAIQPTEIARASDPVPSFERLDLDGNGSLSPAEVLASLRAQDPALFDHRAGRPPVAIERWRAIFARSPAVRARWEHLAFIAAEVQNFDPAHPVPDGPTIHQLSSQGGPGYEAALAALQEALARRKDGDAEPP